MARVCSAAPVARTQSSITSPASRLCGHGARQLRLPVPDLPAARRQTALLLDLGSGMDDGTLCCRALLLAAAYRLHCSHRRKGLLGNEDVVRRALSQAIKEEVRGHTVATRLLDGRWLAVPGSAPSRSRL